MSLASHNWIRIRWARMNIFCIWSTFLILDPNSLKVVITWVQVEVHHSGSSERVLISMIIRIEVKTLTSVCQLIASSPRQQKLAPEIWRWGFPGGLAMTAQYSVQYVTTIQCFSLIPKLILQYTIEYCWCLMIEDTYRGTMRFADGFSTRWQIYIRVSWFLLACSFTLICVSIYYRLQLVESCLNSLLS